MEPNSLHRLKAVQWADLHAMKTLRFHEKRQKAHFYREPKAAIEPQKFYLFELSKMKKGAGVALQMGILVLSKNLLLFH